MADKLNSYLANANNPQPGAWDSLINSIVKTAQYEIYQEEYPRVISCSIDQEYRWGQYRMTTSPMTSAEIYNPGIPAWFPAKLRPDGMIVQAAAAALAKGPFEPIAPGSQPFAPFIDEIPQPILQELAGLAAIRIGQGLLASIPDQEKGKKLAGKMLYRVPFRFIAPFIYRLARMQRTQPSTVIVLNTAIVVLCLAILTAVILLIATGWPVNLPHLIFAGTIALAFLVVWASWLRK